MARMHIGLSSAYVRLALRAYFTIFLLLLGFVGDQCCAQRVKLRLYRHQNVGVSQMTGWLSGTDAVMAWVTMRVSVAGWIGPVMILASLLSNVCDLAVSGLVVGVEVVSRCPFNTTGMYTVITNTPLPARTYDTNARPLYNLITQAQSTTLLNRGLDGIFSKVNTNVKFRADPEDIVCQWKRDATGEQSFQASKSLTAGDDITSALVDDGLLFNQSRTGCWTIHPDNSINQLFIWSASQDDYPTEPWQVRAAVETTEDTEAEMVMEMHTCQMVAPSVDWALQETVPQTALYRWCEEVKGGCSQTILPTLPSC
jgi:hypothetical protein